jgi:enoyl-CoA hydratase/carnithine racemase
MSNPKYIIFDKTDSIATISLNRDELNLLNLEMLEEINSVLQETANDHATRALIIKAAGVAFCGGLDYAGDSHDDFEKLIHTYHKTIRLLDKLECPTISLLHGAALGAGCELACICDFVLAIDGVKLGLPEIKMGLIPTVAIADFPRYGHRKQIDELIMLGDTVTAEEAKSMGLVNRVYAKADFDTRSREFVYRLTANPASSLCLAKRALRAGMEMKFADALGEIEGIYLRKLMLSDDAKAGLEAMKKRRIP